MPNYGSGTFTHPRGDDERIVSPELFNTVVESSSSALQIITNKDNATKKKKPMNKHEYSLSGAVLSSVQQSSGTQQKSLSPDESNNQKYVLNQSTIKTIQSAQWQGSYEQQTVEEIFKIKNENLTMQDIVEKISSIAIQLAR